MKWAPTHPGISLLSPLFARGAQTGRVRQLKRMEVENKRSLAAGACQDTSTAGKERL